MLSPDSTEATLRSMSRYNNIKFFSSHPFKEIMSKSICLNCGTSEQDRPLLTLKFQGEEFYICPQCLPILIHKPYELADKFPEFTPPENPPPDDH